MKKIIVLIGVIGLLSFSNVSSEVTVKENTKKEMALDGIFFLVNNTASDVPVYVGSDPVLLKRGSRTRISCIVGQEVRFDNGGVVGDVIFTIESSHCGISLMLANF
jgi:hypothetical protein